jgi:hypothetical protein
MVGFEMVVNLFVHLALERQGKMDIGRISDDTKGRLNRLVIGAATMAADHFRKRGSRLSSPADL